MVGGRLCRLAVAAAPPQGILEVALALPECAGILVDTRDKAGARDESWLPMLERVHETSQLCLAGGVDESRIARLASGPRLFRRPGRRLAGATVWAPRPRL